MLHCTHDQFTAITAITAIGLVLVLASVQLGCGRGDQANEQALRGARPGTIHVVYDFKASADGYEFLSQGPMPGVWQRADLVGKPVLNLLAPGGVDLGNDAPLEARWATIPEDLALRFDSQRDYAPGPYDYVAVFYIVTPVSADAIAGKAPPPGIRSGDLAVFSADYSRVKPGEPRPQGGSLRINLEDGDATLAVSNRVSSDPYDPGKNLAAATDSIFYFP